MLKARIYTHSNFIPALPSASLLTFGFGSCGTVRIDRRNIPATFKVAVPKKGEIATYRDGDLLGLKWKDKRLASMLLTIHDDSMVTKQRCTKQVSGGSETIQKPKVIKEFNQYNVWSRQKRSVSDIILLWV